MKIEIEYEEVEKLKRQLSQSEEKVRELEEKIKSLDEEEVWKVARKAAESLLKEVLLSMSKQLGFEDTRFVFNEIDFAGCEHWLGKEWYKNQRYGIEFGVRITNKFRELLFNMGIDRGKGKVVSLP